jgi:hypothetical protein
VPIRRAFHPRPAGEQSAPALKSCGKPVTYQ